MRHLALALALLGMVAAAPSAEAPSEDQASRSRGQRTEISSLSGTSGSSTSTTSSHLDQRSTSHLQAPPRRHLPEEDSTTDLSAALRDLARRKRQASGHSHRPYSSPLRSISGIHRPYSAFRPLSRIRRYRYPLYRKRSYDPAQDYENFEDEFQLPVLDQDLSDDYEEEEDYQRPSLFRERTVKRASSFRENSLEDNDGAFSETPIPSDSLLQSAYEEPMVKKDSVYNLAHAPYDLHAMGRLYEVGKRNGGGNLNSSPYKLDSLAHMYSTGKRDTGNIVTSPYQLDTLARMYNAGKRSVNPSGAEQFHEVISALRKRKLEEAIGDSIKTSKRSYTSDAEEYERLRDFFESAAGNYMRRSAGLPDSVVRKRRDVNPVSVSRRDESTAVTTGHNGTNTSQRQQHNPPAKMGTHPSSGAVSEETVPSENHDPSLPAGDRQKRAFGDYFRWDRRKKSVPVADPKGELEKREDYDDFLTREYFKTIARSVGNKKKRMAYAQFEAKKRSVGVEEILESPTMLQYMQDKLKDAEDSTVEEAEELLKGKSDDATVKATLSAVIARLDALERMSEALQQLKELEEAKEVDQKKKRMSPSMVNSAVQERRKKQDEDKRKRTAAAEEEEEQEKRRRRKKGGEEKRKKKRGDGYPLEFLGNAPEEECPVLDRVVVNCNGVSELVGDNDRVFFSACNRHEVCYMCGYSLGVTGHECNALLSSALEASCGGQRDCLGAAADAFAILSDPERYDEEGTCTHDPCIRRYLESR